MFYQEVKYSEATTNEEMHAEELAIKFYRYLGGHPDGVVLRRGLIAVPIYMMCAVIMEKPIARRTKRTQWYQVLAEQIASLEESVRNWLATGSLTGVDDVPMLEKFMSLDSTLMKSIVRIGVAEMERQVNNYIRTFVTEVELSLASGGGVSDEMRGELNKVKLLSWVGRRLAEHHSISRLLSQ